MFKEENYGLTIEKEIFVLFDGLKTMRKLGCHQFTIGGDSARIVSWVVKGFIDIAIGYKELRGYRVSLFMEA